MSVKRNNKFDRADFEEMASLAVQIVSLAPPGAYQYCLIDVAAIPSDPGQFLSATSATARSRGIQEGTYQVEFFDVPEQELLNLVEIGGDAVEVRRDLARVTAKEFTNLPVKPHKR